LPLKDIRRLDQIIVGVDGQAAPLGDRRRCLLRPLERRRDHVDDVAAGHPVGDGFGLRLTPLGQVVVGQPAV
jgi:hypothetical protein